MSAKSNARRRGRDIRKKTGIPLPVAMRAGKLIESGREHLIQTLPLFEGFFHVKAFTCGCCAPEKRLIGPKGDIFIGF